MEFSVSSTTVGNRAFYFGTQGEKFENTQCKEFLLLHMHYFLKYLIKAIISTNPTFENPLKNSTFHLVNKSGVLSGFSKVGFVENYGLNVNF